MSVYELGFCSDTYSFISQTNLQRKQKSVLCGICELWQYIEQPYKVCSFIVTEGLPQQRMFQFNITNNALCMI